MRINSFDPSTGTPDVTFSALLLSAGATDNDANELRAPARGRRTGH
jgi:hypothetical protein